MTTLLAKYWGIIIYRDDKINDKFAKAELLIYHLK